MTSGDWESRQELMERAYRDLVADPAHAVLAYRSDYGPHAALLAGYRGRVLDVGGGHGLVRHWLPADARYVSVDPSLVWLRPEWTALADAFPCLAEPLRLVRGVGEALPFGAETFDAVLAFWSLNHARQPERLVREAHRVLRPGGRLLTVLEDVPPTWRDLMVGTDAEGDLAGRARGLARKLWAVVAGWPLQSDHILIRESDLRRWCSPGFEVTRRAWVCDYLTVELRRT